MTLLTEMCKYVGRKLSVKMHDRNVSFKCVVSKYMVIETTL